MIQTMKNADGIHLMSPLSYEFSMCGDVFDVDAIESDLGEMQPTKGPVTCERCLAVIETCVMYNNGPLSG